MARVKVTGYVEIDDALVDAADPSGLSEEAYIELTEDFLGLDEIDLRVIKD